MQEQKKTFWGLVSRRQCLIPTWRGWLGLGLGLVFLGLVGFHKVTPFLAVTDPLPSAVLVVEGWGPDYAFEAAVAEFRTNHYQKLYVTGGPMEQGGPLSEYKTYAELGAAILLKLGLGREVVQPVSAPRVQRDRTYASAVALKDWWRDHQTSPTKINLITVGPHARRSRLLFEKGLGKDVGVGVISIPDQDFDPAHWWRSSSGVRTIIGEALAYGYARCLFHEPEPQAQRAE
jgi:hypothetical protein